MTEQRRLAAILVADVVGYSKLIGNDEGRTLAQLQSLRTEVIEPRLAKHAGRLFKSVGDGFLIEFASAVQAVTAAQSIQQANVGGNLQLRIGIHVGDVVVQGDDLMGDGVNIAARIEGISEPGGIAISRAVHEQVRDKLDLSFEDKGEVDLKNIVRPVHVFAVAGYNGEPASRESTVLTLPDKPSIAVLPFQNMSGDPEQEYFADGIVEDIITALSRFKSLFVIARNSSFTYKGKAVDIKQVGRELGVRYVLEGSVRKASNRVRITGQLIEAAANRHLWADRFDGALEDVFELQDKVTSSVVGLIIPEVEKAEIERATRKQTESLDSHDLFMRGMAQFYRGDYEQARSFFTNAFELDPEYGAAYAMAAVCLSMRQSRLGVVLSAEARESDLHLAHTAARVSQDDAFVLARVGHVLTYLGHRYDEGMSMVQRAIRLNENASWAWHSYGWVALMCDNPVQSIENFERAMRLSPLDPMTARSWSGIALANMCLGRYDDGCKAATNSIRLRKDAHNLVAYIGNAIGSGHRREVEEAATQLLDAYPEFHVALTDTIFPARSANTRKQIADALRRAGVPE